MAFSCTEQSSAKAELNYKGRGSWTFIATGNSHLFPATQSPDWLSVHLHGNFLCSVKGAVWILSLSTPGEGNPWWVAACTVCDSKEHLLTSSSAALQAFSSWSLCLRHWQCSLGFCYSLWDLAVHSFLFIKIYFLFSQSRTMQVLNSCIIKFRLYIFLSIHFLCNI